MIIGDSKIAPLIEVHALTPEFWHYNDLDSGDNNIARPSSHCLTVLARVPRCSLLFPA